MKQTAPLHPQELFASAFFAAVGPIGVMYHQLLLWGWRLGGWEPVDRRTFGLALALWLLGAALSWGESRRRCIWRRGCLLLGLASLPGLQWWWRQGDGGDALVGSLLLVLCGLCAGGELRWCLRAIAQKSHHPRDLHYFFACLGCLVLPSLCMPYLGVLPGAIAYALCVLAWLYVLHGGALAAAGVGLGLVACAAVPGVFVSAKGFLPVDAAPGFTLETSRRVDELLVRGRRWEFLSSDAHRWAEALVHPVMEPLQGPARVLLLGGETGLALRELLRYPAVARVDIWSPHPKRLAFFRRQPLLRRLHQDSFLDPRVHWIQNQDRVEVLRALQRRGGRYHRIVVELARPWADPRWLHTQAAFFRYLRGSLRKDGQMALGWGELKPHGPFACGLLRLRRVLAKSGLRAVPYRSLGTGVTWAYLAAVGEAAPQTLQIPFGLRYLRQERFPALLAFPPDRDPRKPDACDN